MLVDQIVRNESETEAASRNAILLEESALRTVLTLILYSLCHASIVCIRQRGKENRQIVQRMIQKNVLRRYAYMAII